MLSGLFEPSLSRKCLQDMHFDSLDMHGDTLDMFWCLARLRRVTVQL